MNAAKWRQLNFNSEFFGLDCYRVVRCPYCFVRPGEGCVTRPSGKRCPVHNMRLQRWLDWKGRVGCNLCSYTEAEGQNPPHPRWMCADGHVHVLCWEHNRLHGRVIDQRSRLTRRACLRRPDVATRLKAELTMSAIGDL